MTPPVELGRGRLLLDLHFRDHEGLVACYAFPGEDGWTLVETGPTTCRPALRAALRDAGIEPDSVRRVLLTHIHLDHAGGAGALMEDLPRATFYAHERGVPHLVDPSRLIASARRAWGAAADPLWGTIVPVAADRIRALRGGEQLPVAGGELEVIATPGHAQHHLSFFDGPTRSLLTGDSAGVHVPGAWRARPAIPPPDLDLGQLYRSLEEMTRRAPDRLLYSHFGPQSGAVGELHRYRETVASWVEVGRRAFDESPDVASVARALERYERSAAAESHADTSAEARSALVSGYELAAQGIIRLVQTERKGRPG